jgi:hypothetical protein
MIHIFHNLTDIAHITILKHFALKYNQKRPKLNFPSIFRTNPKAKTQTVQTCGNTNGHKADLVNLTVHLVSNNANLNSVSCPCAHHEDVWVK